MTPEDRELLHRSVALSEENNDILRSIQRHMRLSRFFSLLYWIIIIGTAAGAFYFLKPYGQAILHAYGGAKTNLDNFNTFVNSFKK